MQDSFVKQLIDKKELVKQILDEVFLDELGRYEDLVCSFDEENQKLYVSGYWTKYRSNRALICLTDAKIEVSVAGRKLHFENEEVIQKKYRKAMYKEFYMDYRNYLVSLLDNSFYR